ncbi:MAG TPA: hypothetical protein VF190_14710, partial [Rhodothermales bacterium]
MRRLLSILAAVSLLAGCLATRSGPTGTGSFSFALIGDQQYDPAGEAGFERLMQDLNAEELAFIVHLGDVKASRVPCTDSLLRRRYVEFNESRHPFVFIPGDNEWTDCHRAGGDPLLQLDRLREVFYKDKETLGRSRFEVERQSADSAFAEFSENVRWRGGDVLFVTAHVVGSNNNLGRAPEADAEHARRTRAVLAWLEDSFRIAREPDVRAVLIAMHANPFVGPSQQPKGFSLILERLQTLVSATTIPVVLVHGDTHRCRIDHPLVDSARGDTMWHFTRVEVFGDPFSHWIRGSVDPQNPTVFEFEPVLVAGNPE